MINHTNHIMELEISKMGERGQIVIPQEFRKEMKLKKGEKFLVVKEGDKLIFEPIKMLNAKTLKQIREEIIDRKIIDKFWEQVKKGKVITQSKEDFLKELKTW